MTIASLSESLLASRVARRPGRVVAWLRARRTQVRHAVVSTVAFGCPTAAAFTWHVWAGLVATGIAVLLVDRAVDLPVDERRSP